MKPEWRRYAPVGLVIALLAGLAAFGLYIVQREWNLALQIALLLIVAGLALFVFLDPDRVRKAISGRQARHGSNALLLFVAFFGILVLINYIFYQYPQRWDLTEDKTYTLSPETIALLGELDQPVTARGFFTARVPTDEAEKVLEQFKDNSNGNFNYEFIDPEADPIAAEQAKITRDGTIVLVAGENQELVNTATEQEMAGALVRLMNPEERTVYFLTGHGEYSPDETGEQSLNLAKRALEGKNYTVKTLNLLAENAIPADAKAIIVAGPTKPVSEQEVVLLSDFVQSGGGLVVLQDALPVTDFGDAPDPLADYLASVWSITLGKDLVIDNTSNQPTIAVGSQWGQHPIVNSLAGLVAIMPTARSVTISDPGSASISLATLVSTGQNAWAETDLESLANQTQPVTPDIAKDLMGPVPLGAAGENFESAGRVVAFGDSEFATNAGYTAYANGDLFINSIDWAVGREELISLTPKKTTQRVVVPPQKTAMGLILLVMVFVLPLLALAAAVVVWVMRRMRG
jgi:ABC-type uncharacterized transport system involved in gliding motility auxiliary subunit